MMKPQIAVVTVMQQELNGSSWFINFFLCIGPSYILTAPKSTERKVA
jgi:hypothetical protein